MHTAKQFVTANVLNADIFAITSVAKKFFYAFILYFNSNIQTKKQVW